MSKREKWLIWIYLILLLIDHNRFYHHFIKQLADSDQPLFWLFADDLARAEFHSIFLYGQDYNIPLESILSSPFIAMGATSMSAVPLISLLMGLIPFLGMALYFYQKSQYHPMYLALAMPLIMPLEWTAISSLPRGFLGGIFMAVAGGLLYLSSKKKSTQQLGLVLAFGSIFINPNALLFLLPFLVSLLMERKGSWAKLLFPTGFTLLIFLLLEQYKHRLMEEWVHQAWTIEWSLNSWMMALNQLDLYFKALLPFCYECGVALPVLLLASLGCCILFKQKKAALMLTSVILLLLFSLGLNKVNDGTDSIFFAYSRMFLALPFSLVFIVSQLDVQTGRKYMIWAFCLLIIVGFGLRQLLFSSSKSNLVKNNSAVVQLFNPSNLKEECGELKEILDREKAKLLLFNSQANQFVYGCAGYMQLPTLYPSYERRHWLWKEYEHIPMSELIILDWNGLQDKALSDLTLERVEYTDFPAYRVLKGEAVLSEYFQP